jgi:hypothetical protein
MSSTRLPLTVVRLNNRCFVRNGVRHSLALCIAGLVILVSAPLAEADLADETALAMRYSPVVRLVEQPEECGPGEPYEPTDVDVFLGEETVALRGPWRTTDLVKIAPTAEDLVGRYAYHLDFPGNPLNPGCDYERWSHRLTAGTAPTVYAHVATDPGHPGLALQYWFFYPFNDFNNLHEGDWEMIQLVFKATDASHALRGDPVAIGYSSHEGAEQAAWGEHKLELVDGTHPAVYPAAGSHANKFTAALYLGSSAEAGVGCDDTVGPHVELRPQVRTIPSDPDAARASFPWIAFEGRWGELQPAFFNGPTGPNLKQQWTEPIEWSERWRTRSYAVPAGGLLGTQATDFFCHAVATGSRGLIGLIRNPIPALLVLGALLALALIAGSRTAWRPSAPLRLARRRRWGQILTAAFRMYVGRAPLFLAIGLLFIPLGFLISLLQALVLGGFGLIGIDTSGESAGLLAFLVLTVGTTLTLLGMVLVQAATACALVRIDSSQPVGPINAYRVAFTRVQPLLGGLALAAAVCLALAATWVLIPVAVWLAVRWALLAQVVELENRSGLEGLRRSKEIVRGHWFRVASLIGVGALLALFAGPFLGALLILGTGAPLALLDIIAGVVYALTMPFVALMTAYVYFDTRVRAELEPDPGIAELPAEIEL